MSLALPSTIILEMRQIKLVALNLSLQLVTRRLENPCAVIPQFVFSFKIEQRNSIYLVLSQGEASKHV